MGLQPARGPAGWLTLQAGLKFLLISTTAHLDESGCFLGSMFLGAERESWVFGRKDHNLEEVLELCNKVFRLDVVRRGCKASSAAHVNHSKFFRAPATTLAKLRNLEPVHLNVLKILPFVGDSAGGVSSLCCTTEMRGHNGFLGTGSGSCVAWRASG